MTFREFLKQGLNFLLKFILNLVWNLALCSLIKKGKNSMWRHLRNLIYSDPFVELGHDSNTLGVISRKGNIYVRSKRPCLLCSFRFSVSLGRNKGHIREKLPQGQCAKKYNSQDEQTMLSLFFFTICFLWDWQLTSLWVATDCFFSFLRLLMCQNAAWKDTSGSLLE